MSAPSKEQFYQSLDADTWCGWDWCRKLYAYQVTDVDFLKCVYDRLDALNRGEVKHIYCLYFKTQIAHELAEQKDAAGYEVEQTDKIYERQVREWQKKEKLQSTKSDYWKRQSERVEELKRGLISR